MILLAARAAGFEAKKETKHFHFFVHQNAVKKALDREKSVYSILNQSMLQCAIMTSSKHSIIKAVCLPTTHSLTDKKQ